MYNTRIDAKRRRVAKPKARGAIPLPIRQESAMIEQAVIDGIVERVVEIAQPQKVILFGSAARGDTGPHSDIDLLIIKDGENAWDLMRRIRSGLSRGGPPVDIIVASTATIERYKNSHALVYKPALREGKVMYESQSEYDPDEQPPELPPPNLPPGRYPADDPREWLRRANNNLTRAITHIPDADLLEDMCWDAQQAAEKAIKARLISLDVEFPYTHKIEELLDCLEAAGDDIPDEVRAATMLTEFATVTRYPWCGAPVTEEQHIAATTAATATVRWVETLLSQPQ